MSPSLVIPLQTSPEQAARLLALQETFAEACNALSPIMREHRCWNRVALHHMTYRLLRERFPQLGSQMACNAIYSVCRAGRLLYQTPGSPFNVARFEGRELPLIQFTPNTPVYFDRHTLSLRNGRLSMYTLDGRIRFDLDLPPADEVRFHAQKLREVMLVCQGEQYHLRFIFEPKDSAEPATPFHDDPGAPAAVLPDYLHVSSDMPPPTNGLHA